MKKHLYTLIPMLVLAGPLALSFDERVHFFTHALSVLGAVAVVGTLYLLWDVLVTRRGDWRFNSEYVGEARLWGLPVGEYLFFAAVPYACLFLYEVSLAYFPSAVWFEYPPWLDFLGAAGFLGAALVWRKKGYTLLAFLSCGVFLASAAFFFPGLWGRSEVLFYFALSFGAFLVVDGIYTALPTIFYRPQAVLGPRALTIPIEDFFYNFSMLGLYLIVYRLIEGGGR